LESGVEFVAVDNPHTNKLTAHILAAAAQHEREPIAQRTRDALQGRQGARQEARRSEARDDVVEWIKPEMYQGCTPGILR
jgi:DNA invertase Pin-like site-specific DNA recombinase